MEAHMSNIIDFAGSTGEQSQPAIGPGPRLIPTRTLYTRGSKAGTLATTNLEEVRKRAAEINKDE